MGENGNIFQHKNAAAGLLVPAKMGKQIGTAIADTVFNENHNADCSGHYYHPTLLSR